MPEEVKDQLRQIEQQIAQEEQRRKDAAESQRLQLDLAIARQRLARLQERKLDVLI